MSTYPDPDQPLHLHDTQALLNQVNELCDRHGIDRVALWWDALDRDGAEMPTPDGLEWIDQMDDGRVIARAWREADRVKVIGRREDLTYGEALQLVAEAAGVPC